MTTEELRDLVERDEAAWNAHDAERLASLFSRDLEYRSVALRPSDPRGWTIWTWWTARLLSRYYGLGRVLRQPRGRA